MYRRYNCSLSFAAPLLLLAACSKPPSGTTTDSVCAGPPLTSIEARNDAMEAGYEINQARNCIDKKSFDAINAQQVAWEQAQTERVASERVQMAASGSSNFAQARHGFNTKIAVHDADPLSLPSPPENLFVRSDYRNPQNTMLAGFVSPDPRDGKRHPAIVWLTGGDSNSLSDFWTKGPVHNDQSASAFREAGLIMSFPTLRGGNGNDSAKEIMLGEVEDVIAAAEQLARLSYVDPDRIYLGGHSTGGTLALLTAAMNSPFKAVFAFGPVARIDRYPASLTQVEFSVQASMEIKLRSPIHWLADIAQPTFVIEGADGQSNISELQEICAASRNARLHCLEVRGADHFGVLSPATRAIAGKLAATSGGEISLTSEELMP
jgi:pimeloyl-ACP methyl ester carboxylesterase